MKKITIMNLHLGVGGIEKYISGLTKMFQNDYELELIVTYKLDSSPIFDFDKKIKIKYLIDGGPNREEIKTSIKNRKIFNTIKEIFKAIKILYLKRSKTINEIKNLDTDYLITTRLYETKLANKILKKNGNIVKIATEHNFPTPTYKNKLVKATTNFDKLIVVNNEIKEIYQNIIGNKVVCIPNFIDTISKDMHNIKNKNLVAVGRFSPEKGFIDLIEIMSLIVKKDKEVTLTLIGDGQEMNQIKELVKKLNLENNVKLPGYLNQSEIKNIMLNSSIYLMTSYTESFGLVILEAMNYGLPVVAFNTASGPKELLQETGVLVNGRDKNSFVSEVLELLHDKEKLQKKSLESKNVVSKYSMKNIEKQYINLLEQMLSVSQKKVMFISSAGGHLSEMLMLKDMFDKYKYQIITETSQANEGMTKNYGRKNVKFLIESTPNHKLSYCFKLPINCFKSLYYYIKFRPDFIISTGAHTAGPMCCIGKLFGSKIIFIESFANSDTKTKTGNLIYKFADLFIVQWDNMVELYPKSVYGGWIY